MLTPDTLLRLHPSIVLTRLDDTEAVLLHLDTKRYYALNETGACIAELLQAGTCANALVDVLRDDYDLIPDETRRYILEFLEELVREDLARIMEPLHAT